ncbi:MAG: hypothetical protein M1822_003639 [Bathelium mastoideum]|nr:MAG: hypothetical protein M1822_003639 [Bathelium mastoideum]
MAVHESVHPSPPILNIPDTVVTVNIKTLDESILIYKVHKGLICDSSENFKALFTNGMDETERQEVTLDEDEDIHGFPMFMRWLYTGSLSATPKELDEVGVEQLCQAYIFADKRLVPNIQPALIDTIVKKLAKSAADPPKSLINMVYSQLPAGSPLKNVFASFTAHVTRNPNFIAGYDGLPTEFLSDVAVNLMEALGSSQLEMVEDWGNRTYLQFQRGASQRDYRDDKHGTATESDDFWFHTVNAKKGKKKVKGGW